MTSISIFLIWSDSILNNFWINWNPYLTLQCTSQNSEMTQYALPTQLRCRGLWCSAKHFPMKGDILSAGWGMVRKNISCFKTSFQPLLHPVVSPPTPCSHHQGADLFSAGTPAQLAILQGRPWAYSSTKPSLPDCIFPAAPVLLFYEMGCRTEPEARSQFQCDLWAAGPLQSLTPKDITLSSLVPEPLLVLISLLSFCSPATYDPIFSFSNLSGSSHHVKQWADLAWKNAVNCFLKTWMF